MIELLIQMPPLDKAFDKTKYNGSRYNPPMSPRKYRAHESPFVLNAKPWNPLGRHPFNIITEEVLSD